MSSFFGTHLFQFSQSATVSGDTVSRFLKFTSSLNQDTFIVAMTNGELAPEQSQEFDDILTKPASPEVLARVLGNLFNLPPEAR